MQYPQSKMAILAVLLLGVFVLVHAQETQGPMPQPPKFDVHRISSVPHPGPPPIPQREIVQKFAANEDVVKKIYDTYTFTQTIRIDELNTSGGQFNVVGQVYTKPDGSRYWRPTQPPQSTLKLTDFSIEDMHTIVDEPLFFLETPEIGNYDFTYAGQDKLDELNTYVFQVKPRQVSRTRRYFEGAIWVDDHDLAIVKTYGKFVDEISDHDPKLPFTMFETYRENFQGKYWLPTYTSADDYVDSKDGSVHLRLVVRATDFKLSATPVQAPAPALRRPAE